MKKISMVEPFANAIVSTTNDIFCIQGARESFEEAKKSYNVFGKTENINMIESMGGHESTLQNREAVYSFFQKYLGINGDSRESKIEELAEDELQVAPTGQVVSSYQSKTVFDLIKESTINIIKERRVNSPKELSYNKELLLNKILKLSGFKPSRAIERVVYTGEIEKDKYIVEKYLIQGADFSYPIPFVFIKPDTKEKRPLLLYLDSSGKESLLNKEEEINEYINNGYTIVAPDLIGIGELKNSLFKGDSYIQEYSYNLLFGANLAGNSIAGMQSSDLDVIFEYVMARSDVDKDNVASIISGEVCSSYLHYAIFNKNIKKTILINPLISFESITQTKLYDPCYILSSVPGAIRYYDLHYLESLLVPTELTIIDPVNARGDVVNHKDANKELTFIKEYYKLNNYGRKFRIVLSEKEGGTLKIGKFL